MEYESEKPSLCVSPVYLYILGTMAEHNTTCTFCTFGNKTSRHATSGDDKEAGMNESLRTKHR